MSRSRDESRFEDGEAYFATWPEFERYDPSGMTEAEDLYMLCMYGRWHERIQATIDKGCLVPSDPPFRVDY